MPIPAIGGGLRKRRYIDNRNYDFQRTFGSVEAFHAELDLDAGKTNPNQNEPDPRFGNPAYPQGCTGFTTTDIATDEDGIVYDPGFTIRKTALVSDGPEGGPFTIKDSMTSATDYGVRAAGESDTQALSHRRAPYFETRPNGMTWSDAVRSAMQLKRRSLSAGIPWDISFTLASKGVVDSIPSDLPKRAKTMPIWHDVKICGWKSMNGRVYLKIKAWVGPKWGDNGFYWFSENVLNALLAIPGAGVFSNAHAQPEDIKAVQLTIQQTLLQYLYRLLGLYKKYIETSPEVPLEASVSPVEPSLPTNPPPMTIGINDLYEDWGKPKNAWHNVRVLCDRAGLSLAEKNVICQCIYQESTFLNSAIGRNSGSTDWGLVQVNDYWNIGPGKPFPSVAYVVNHPEECVNWMIKMYKQGQLKLWASCSSGAYKKWGAKNSPMWKLAN